MQIVSSPVSFNLTFASDGAVSGVGGNIEPSWSGHCFLKDGPVAAQLGAQLTPELADLVDVAHMVSVADRLCRRKGLRIEKWTRSITLTIPVRDPARWSALAELLQNFFWHLTEDEWIFRFVQRTHPLRRAEQQEMALFPKDVPVIAALFSGGLDSFAGLCRDLIAHPQGRVLLFSADLNDQLGAAQRKLIDEMKRRTGRDFEHVSLKFGYHRHERSYDLDEPTQRVRGFVFLALGAVVALMGRANTLSVYENGVGAINLPYSAAQFGVQQSRAVSPETLVRISEIVRHATDRSFAFRLPFLFETKATLCGGITALDVCDLIGKTGSCDSFLLLRKPGVCQCGTCTSCLLRRQSLHAAGLASFDSSYLRDVLNPSSDMTRLHRHPLQMMQMQVRDLGDALRTVEPWQALCSRYPDLILAADAARMLGFAGDVESRLVALFRRYHDEWRSFPAVPVWHPAAVAA